MGGFQEFMIQILAISSMFLPLMAGIIVLVILWRVMKSLDSIDHSLKKLVSQHTSTTFTQSLTKEEQE